MNKIVNTAVMLQKGSPLVYAKHLLWLGSRCLPRASGAQRQDFRKAVGLWDAVANSILEGLVEKCWSVEPNRQGCIHLSPWLLCFPCGDAGSFPPLGLSSMLFSEF